MATLTNTITQQQKMTNKSDSELEMNKFIICKEKPDSDTILYKFPIEFLYKITKYLFSYHIDVNLNNYKSYIKSIQFNIGRWGKNKKTLYFNIPITEFQAVKLVELYLSKPIDEEYYSMLKNTNDLVGRVGMNYNFQKEKTLIRGDLLGDAKYLETFEMDDDGNAFICCGS